MEEIKSWLAVAASLLALGTAAWNWISSPARAVEAKVGRLTEVVADQDRRLAHVEETIEHLPDRESLHSMQVSITELKGEIQVLAERLKPVAAIADRLQEHVLAEARK